MGKPVGGDQPDVRVAERGADAAQIGPGPVGAGVHLAAVAGGIGPALTGSLGADKRVTMAATAAAARMA